ncbi:hypothetical protein EDB86DRAFT_3091422 [Lactarius hatsudake]|nr:hypothetical protein EDB86DRAFT_3091422 [Lactarius hatsudake]
MARDSQFDNVTLNHPCGFSTDAKKLTPPMKIQKDPGARLPNLKVSIIPSILPVNDLAIDPFRPVFAASPVPKMLRWRLRPDSRRLRSFRRHARRPIRCVGLATLFLVLDAHDPAGCRSQPVEEDVRRREVEGKRPWGVRSTLSTTPTGSACGSWRLLQISDLSHFSRLHQFVGKAPNYLRQGHRSGSELNKDPGARLPSLEVNVIPSVFPADLSIDPFRPVSPQDPLHGDATMLATSVTIHAVSSAASEPTSTRGGKTQELGAAVGRSRRTCAGARQRASSSVRAQQDQYVPSVSSLKFSEIPGARECTCPAKTRLHYDPNAALPLRANAAPPLRGLVPAHEYPFVLHQRTRPPSHRIQAERERRRSRYISWNAYALLLFELVPKDGGQVDQVE